MSRVLLHVVGLLCAVLAALLGAARLQADGARAPGGNLANPAVRQIDIASLAVVRIATLYTAHITLTLCGTDHTLPTSGQGYTVGALGSGAFISAHGDILTADHVVNVEKSALDSQIFQDDRAAHDIAALLNTTPGCQASVAVSATDVANGIVQYAGIPYHTSYSAPQLFIWRSASYTGPLSSSPDDKQDIVTGLMAADHTAATVTQESSLSQNDLAILHTSLSDTPSIGLDDSANVAVEDHLTVIGFPGNGDAASNDPTNLLTPSVNSVSVSAIKENDNGEKLIQVGGNVEHGDSGGPVLDDAGRIVGVVSFGGTDPQGSTAFLRSSDSARALIASAAIDTSPGTFQRLWQRAFADYAASDSHHWHRAARDLDTLHQAYPDVGGIMPYRAYADQASRSEPVSPDSGITLALLARFLVVENIAGLALLCLVLLVVLLVPRARRRRMGHTGVAGNPAVRAGMPPIMPPAMLPMAGYTPTVPHPSTAGGYGDVTGRLPQEAQASASASPRANEPGWLAIPALSGTPSAPPGTAGSMPAAVPVAARRDSVRPGTDHAQHVGEASPAGISERSVSHRVSPPYGPTSWQDHADASSIYSQVGYCENGHMVASGMATCALCGAARIVTGSSSPPSGGW